MRRKIGPEELAGRTVTSQITERGTFHATSFSYGIRLFFANEELLRSAKPDCALHLCDVPLIVHILREKIPSLGAVLSKLPQAGEIMGVKVSLGTILLALLIAFVSRAVKMHDRLSNLLRIRRNFDVREILVPLAVKTIGSPTEDKLARITRQRDRLMDQVFYQYVSSTRHPGEIDSHLIEGALDQWSWFWCLLETAALLTLTAFALVVSGAAD